MSTTPPIYLDNNASTPVHPQVVEAMLPHLQTHYGNPSSSHALGQTARRAIEEARAQVAELLGCTTPEVVFTSGGTESNNFALQGACFAENHHGARIVTSTIEHPAIHAVCEFLSRFDIETTRFGVDEFGRCDLGEMEQALAQGTTTLVSLMHANNEVGTIQPISRVSSLARNRGALVHSDAAQSVGKIPTRVDDLGVDLLSIAGHKLYAPKGVGALYIRKGVRLARYLHGADHERGRRAGTEAVAQIVGLGKACELAQSELATRGQKLRALRDRLEAGILARFPQAVVNGPRANPEERLPNTLSVSFPGLRGSDLLESIPQVIASTSSACHSGSAATSSTLQAMEVPGERAQGTLRLSVGCFNTEEEIDRAVEIIGAGVENALSPDSPAFRRS